MLKKKARPIVFVCSSIQNGVLINKIITASSHEEAGSLFFNQFSIKAKEVLGPFYKKRARVLEDTRICKFTNKSKKAYYDNWLVNAIFLEEPKDYVYLIFIKRTDNKKIPAPRGTIIIPVSDLNF